MKKLLNVLDRLNRHVAAVGFIADRVEDQQASMALSTIEKDMTRTVKKIQKKLKSQ